MNKSLKPYPAYKNSYIDWIKKVPEHWEIRKLRHILYQKTENNLLDLPLLSVIREKGVILRDITNQNTNRNYIPDDLTNYKVVHINQFVINKMKAWQGSYGISAYEGIVSPAYFVFNINFENSQYFHTAIRSRAYIPFFTQASDGIRIGQWDLYQTRLREIPFFIPPFLEQNAIVRFLDYMSKRIQYYINAKKKLIKLLEEYKQSLIQQAVTGQINVRTGKPYLAYKSSGNEWIGDIPEHWEERRLRNVAKIIVSNVDKQQTGGESLVRLCNYIDVYKNDCINENISFMIATAKEEEIVNFRLEKDDVLITKDSEMWNDIGVPSIVTYTANDFICGYHLAILRSKKEILFAKYLFYTLKTSSIIYQLHISANGVTRYGLTHGSIKSLWLLLPALSEQTAIVTYLDKKTAFIDQSISTAKREIELLSEYRTRLITDVVTGKLDVREAATNLPEEIKESKFPEEEEEVFDEDKESLEDIETSTVQEESDFN